MDLNVNYIEDYQRRPSAFDVGCYYDTREKFEAGTDCLYTLRERLSRDGAVRASDTPLPTCNLKDFTTLQSVMTNRAPLSELDTLKPSPSDFVCPMAGTNVPCDFPLPSRLYHDNRDLKEVPPLNRVDLVHYSHIDAIAHNYPQNDRQLDRDEYISICG